MLSAGLERRSLSRRFFPFRALTASRATLRQHTHTALINAAFFFLPFARARAVCGLDVYMTLFLAARPTPPPLNCILSVTGLISYFCMRLSFKFDPVNSNRLFISQKTEKLPKFKTYVKNEFFRYFYKIQKKSNFTFKNLQIWKYLKLEISSRPVILFKKSHGSFSFCPHMNFQCK